MNVIRKAEDLITDESYWVMTIPGVEHWLKHWDNPVRVTIRDNPVNAGYRAMYVDGSYPNPFWISKGNDYFTDKLTAIGPIPKMDKEQFEKLVDLSGQ